MNKFLFLAIATLWATACKHVVEDAASLRLDLVELVNEAPGCVGVALITDGDTILVNNGAHYPMMSVFKLHQAIAVAHELEQSGSSLDSILTIRFADLDRHTWSPMLADVDTTSFDMSVRQLMDYALTASDNNASNILFERILSPQATNSTLHTLAPDSNFVIDYSEAQMKADHALSYCNYSSPLSAALLIKQLYEDSPLNDPENTNAIIAALENCTTGQDRIGAPLADLQDVRFGHKTGSGYRNSNNELVAHNDVAYIVLPNGSAYSLAIFIRDFSGTEQDASALMARISARVLEFLNK